MAERWFLVQFKPNSHKVAQRNLERQGVKTFLPMQEITRRQETRFISELRPLFPGYLFVRLDPDTSPWRKINSTYGVSRIVSFHDIPAPVPNGLVESLIDRCDVNGGVLGGENFQRGDEVKVVEGPFAEFTATIETIDPDKRVWLLLDFMGQATRIKVKASQIVGK